MIAKSLPNLFTLGNLFLGIIALILAFEGNIPYAAIMVIIGMLLDGLDGRVARLLNAQSEFGKELDSLSDIITFGVAPAFIMYEILLYDFGIPGIIITGIFPICGALRLARFNSRPVSSSFFLGLPITAAGGILATLSLYAEAVENWVLIAGMLVLSFLMVSSIKYPNFKKVGFPKKSIVAIPLMFGLVVLLAYVFPRFFPEIIFVPLGLYALFGVYRAWRIVIRRRRVKNVNYRKTNSE